MSARQRSAANAPRHASSSARHHPHSHHAVPITNAAALNYPGVPYARTSAGMPYAYTSAGMPYAYTSAAPAAASMPYAYTSAGMPYASSGMPYARTSASLYDCAPTSAPMMMHPAQARTSAPTIADLGEMIYDHQPFIYDRTNLDSDLIKNVGRGAVLAAAGTGVAHAVRHVIG